MIDEKTVPSPQESSDPAQQEQIAHRLSYASLDRPILARKYSHQWWKSSWDRAIAHRVWPRVFYAFFGVSLIAIWVGITFYFASEGTRWDRGDDQPFEQRLRAAAAGEGLDDSEDLISLSGSLKSFNPVARTLHVEWSGLYQKTAKDKPEELATGIYPNTKTLLNIYRDVSTVLYEDRDNSTRVVDPFYWFRIDNSTATNIATIGAHPWDSFDTEISFSQDAEEANAKNQPQYSYPFDKWKGSIIFVADYLPNGLPYYSITPQGNYSRSWAYPLAGARLEDNSLNWRFSLNFTNPCSNDIDIVTPIIQKSLGPYDEPVDKVLKNDSLLALVNVPCHLAIIIVATRPPLVQFSAVMAVIVNWTSTLFIFILTCEVIIMRRGFMLSGTDLLAITFTALFALPSVRMLLPGAPEFGILLDMVGIIPNVIIVSLCITAIAITKLNRRKHPDQKED